MKITKKLLSLPPYISTTWDQIKALSFDTKNNQLLIQMKNDAHINIPNLSSQDIETIFSYHEQYVENLSSKKSIPDVGSLGLGIPIGENGGTIEGLGMAMQHNPEQKNGPDLPKEVLAKITTIAKSLGLDKMENLPEAEPHCNCFHCQLSRALHAKTPLEEENEDEEVSDEELRFRSWDITQTAEKLYIVTNPLDEQEKYQVFLGHPVGCTCGQANCEHIRAVLNS